MAREKRKERRLKANLPIKITPPDKSLIDAQTENISRLGTYIEIKQGIRLGVHLDLEIEIPDYANNLSLAGAVKCKGDVFRCALLREIESKKIYGVGIFFTGFSGQQDRNKLSKYIDFLIFQEEEKVKQATQRWREKREKRQDAQ